MRELAEEADWAGAAAAPDEGGGADATPAPASAAPAVGRLPPNLSLLVIASLAVAGWTALIVGVALMPLWASP